MSNKKQMTKFGFIVSSLGAAIGLGAIWGLPGYIRLLALLVKKLQIFVKKILIEKYNFN
ncbi:hypothetical protein [Spiroplasma poulsonii]|uniref:hypothetical protein n=1 Tax=Spiroplasma poulsonii TaxID=2138 RepID=UPI001319D71E|nr:hypothetical protein [Spiroplasma poulsonii]